MLFRNRCSSRTTLHIRYSAATKPSRDPLTLYHARGRNACVDFVLSLQIEHSWRATTDAAIRGWIEQRILNDAGILGHYVAVGSNHAHASVHHHG